MNTRHYRSRLSLLGIMVIASCASLAPLMDRQAAAPELPGFGVVRMTVTTSVPAALLSQRLPSVEQWWKRNT